MTRRIFRPEFKREAAQLVVVRGVSVAQASRVLGPLSADLALSKRLPGNG